MKTGAIVLLPELGSISLTERMVLALQEAGVIPVVLVSSGDPALLIPPLAKLGVVFLQSTSATGAALDGIKTGLEYFKERVDQVLVVPTVDLLVTSATISQLIRLEKPLIRPTYEGKTGQLFIISQSLFSKIIGYQGQDGLEGAVAACKTPQQLFPVTDDGISPLDQSLPPLLEPHPIQPLRANTKLRIAREEPFFGPGTAHLLALIEDCGSVRLACTQMGLSYSKGWKMIDTMEQQLGCSIVKRQKGGKAGGKADLSPRGKQFLNSYNAYQSACKEEIDRLFHEHFGRFSLGQPGEKEKNE